jgi:hypothetical protein
MAYRSAGFFAFVRREFDAQAGNSQFLPFFCGDRGKWILLEFSGECCTVRL